MSRLCCFFWFLLLGVSQAKADYVSVEVGVDGFTCSMCAMSVENSLRQLSFVERIEMDLNNHKALIFFRKDRPVSIRKIADKVYDSGFSVRYIHAQYDFPELSIDDFYSFQAGQEEFHFIATGKRSLKGLVTIVFLNKKLISGKEYTRWEPEIKKDIKIKGKKESICYITLLDS